MKNLDLKALFPALVVAAHLFNELCHQIPQQRKQ